MLSDKPLRRRRLLDAGETIEVDPLCNVVVPPHPLEHDNPSSTPQHSDRWPEYRDEAKFFKVRWHIAQILIETGIRAAAKRRR